MNIFHQISAFLKKATNVFLIKLGVSKTISFPLQNKVNRKELQYLELFPKHSLENELSINKLRLSTLQERANRITKITATKSALIESKVKNLSNYIAQNVTTINFRALEFPSQTQIEKRFSKDYSFLNRHIDREKERKALARIQKGQIRSKLALIETLLTQNDLGQAKKVIEDTERIIKQSHFEKFKDRIKTLKQKYENQKLFEYEVKQAEIIKGLKEKAEVERIVAQARQEQERIRQIQILEQKNREKERERQKQLELDSLLTKRTDWQEIATILTNHNIKIIYHFTDKSNINSIIQYNGLFSWFYCDKANIQIPVPGGDPTSRYLDTQHGLKDYVRLSFIPDHPMKFVACRDHRIFNPVVLKIDTGVCFLKDTVFADMNAADGRHQDTRSYSSEMVLDFLKNNIHYPLFKRDYLSLEGMDRKYYQAEILAKTWIPIDYILNINELR